MLSIKTRSRLWIPVSLYALLKRAFRGGRALSTRDVPRFPRRPERIRDVAV